LSKRRKREKAGIRRIDLIFRFSRSSQRGETPASEEGVVVGGNPQEQAAGPEAHVCALESMPGINPRHTE
jgi:hypothetical protein